MSLLNELYQNASVKTARDQRIEELANDDAVVELFQKVAADNNIDLAAMNDQQIEAEYGAFVAKLAEDEEKDKDKGKDAPAEWEEQQKEEYKKKEAAAVADIESLFSKIAAYQEADQMGRVLAHAVVDELHKIASGDTSSSAELATKVASTLAVQEIGATPGLDTFAADRACAILKEANYPDEAIAEAYTKIAALYDLGKFDSSNTKIAAANSRQAVVDIRALEQLEQIGVPVNWNTVFGGLALAGQDQPGTLESEPIPTPRIVSTPAPGKRGPVGLAPRTNYSRANTLPSPVGDGGAAEQKTLEPPKVAMRYGNTMQSILAGSLDEALRLVKSASAQPEAQDKVAAKETPSDEDKLAAALEELAEVMDKEAEDESNTHGSAHASSTTTTGGGAHNPGPSGQGHAKHQPPHAGTLATPPGGASRTSMPTFDVTQPMAGPAPKVASILDKLAKMSPEERKRYQDVMDAHRQSRPGTARRSQNAHTEEVRKGLDKNKLTVVTPSPLAKVDKGTKNLANAGTSAVTKSKTPKVIEGVLEDAPGPLARGGRGGGGGGRPPIRLTGGGGRPPLLLGGGKSSRKGAVAGLVAGLGAAATGGGVALNKHLKAQARTKLLKRVGLGTGAALAAGGLAAAAAHKGKETTAAARKDDDPAVRKARHSGAVAGGLLNGVPAALIGAAMGGIAAHQHTKNPAVIAGAALGGAALGGGLAGGLGAVTGGLAAGEGARGDGYGEGMLRGAGTGALTGGVLGAAGGPPGVAGGALTGAASGAAYGAYGQYKAKRASDDPQRMDVSTHTNPGTGPTGVLATNESATNFTRGTAYKNRIEELKKLLDEPIGGSADTTLRQVFSNTSKADPKVAQKTAATVLLEKMQNGGADVLLGFVGGLK